jgi:hypothetical protein
MQTTFCFGRLKGNKFGEADVEERKIRKWILKT